MTRPHPPIHLQNRPIRRNVTRFRVLANAVAILLQFLHTNLFAVDREAFFRERIEPMLKEHCYECHSHAANKMSGGLTLDSSAGWKIGGDSGPSIVPGKPEESRLLRALKYEGLEMPPNKPLPARAIDDFRRWIETGAYDPRQLPIRNRDEDWWSLKPLFRPEPPPAYVDRFPNAIDRFVAAKLEESGLSFSPLADRPTLIRRLTLDLWGLPPTFEEIDQFENDSDPDAYEKLVDRLLASPRYGERWARHWMDVVHFGESNGFGMDRPRMTAWPYRDYLIHSLNEDKPYERFIQEQIAADVLFPNEPQWIPALGFAAAGPFNQSALVEQVDDTECKKIALHLDRDDMVSTTCTTFLSLTVHCARCHAHKFDPISQRDYYRLQAIFAGVGRAERPFDLAPEIRDRRAKIRKHIQAIEKGEDPTPIEETENVALERDRIQWEQSYAAYAMDWKVIEADSIRSNSNETSFQEQFDHSWLAGGKAADKDTYTIEATLPTSNPKALRLDLIPDPSLPKRGPGRQANGNLHLSEIRFFWIDSESNPVEIAWRSAAADFNQSGWGIDRAIDGKRETAWGIHPEIGKEHQAIFTLGSAPAMEVGSKIRIELVQEHGTEHLLGRFRLLITTDEKAIPNTQIPFEIADPLAIPASQRSEESRKNIERYHRLVFWKKRLAELPPERSVWAITSNFEPIRNYKPPRLPNPIAVLRRGDIHQPGTIVAPGAIDVIGPLGISFSDMQEDDEAARRAALARWISSPENMLTWRSVVNRVWHWHFGRGIVETPNDFGRMGALPSHPDLLDWLAFQFREQGGSLKALHRWIVTSTTYRQSSSFRLDGDEIDADNRLLWRMNRKRLDAESVRDAILRISGRIDLMVGGPSAMQFHYSDPNMNVSPRIDYVNFDHDSPEAARRSVYRFLFRNLNDPLLEALDAVDPSLSTPSRNVTITPIQSLSMWNNPFILKQCGHIARRIEKESESMEARIEMLFRSIYGRRPTEHERKISVDFASTHGLENLSRVLINSNDFLFIH